MAYNIPMLLFVDAQSIFYANAIISRFISSKIFSTMRICKDNQYYIFSITFNGKNC